mmetsp:Transcript_47296/g.143781  ORF Transcript_47296/g.143781 Transcript_47296/m.143781 type:complete len:305 (+) Transcript_47296:69-983(+)
MLRGPERLVPSARRAEPEQSVGDGARVAALLPQLNLLVLECLRRVHVGQEAEKQGLRVFGQFLLAQALQTVQLLLGLELGRCADRDHARPPILAARHLHPVDVGLHDAWVRRDDLRNLHRGTILALPPEGVADPVHKKEIAVGVLRQKVACPEEAVALHERVLEELLLCGALVRVALEPLSWVVLHVRNDELSRLAIGALDAEAVRSANHLLRLDIEFDDPSPEDFGQERAGAPHSASTGFVLPQRKVDQCAVALRGAVELRDQRDPEPILEVVPHLGAQSVPHGALQLVGRVQDLGMLLRVSD